MHVTGHGQHPPLNGNQQHQQHGQQERRRRTQYNGEHQCQSIELAVGMQTRPNAQRQTPQRGQKHRGSRQLQRGTQLVLDFIPHGLG